ncbi:MAG TPA: hypothetical protein VKG45_01400 [Actinomycetes bacterium]|nr:hypothetical protein [Actinomycetes bacterium]
MKGAIAVILGFLLLPGSVVVLLAANLGALKGYLLGAISFFGFLFMLSIIWTLGLPGTPALTGPQGPLPTFKLISAQGADAQRFSRVSQFTGGEGNGWQAAPSPTGSDKKLSEELTAAEQAAVAAFVEDYNRNVKQSSKEADVVNLQTRTFYTVEDGTTVAATVISPKTPPAGSGLERPSFAPVTQFAYRDPGFPNLYNYAFMAGSLLLVILHVLLLARAERRNPLGPVSQPAATGARARA